MLLMDHIYVQNIQGATAVDLVCLVVDTAQGTDSIVHLPNWYWLPGVLCCTFCLCVTLWIWIYRWFLGYTCCDACGRLFVKGNYCPVCLKVQMLCSQYQNDLFELFEIYYALFNFGVSIFLVYAPPPYNIVVACARYFVREVFRLYYSSKPLWLRLHFSLSRSMSSLGS